MLAVLDRVRWKGLSEAVMCTYIYMFRGAGEHRAIPKFNVHFQG